MGEIRVSGGLLGLEFQSQEICKAVFDALLEADEGLLTKWGGRGYRTLIFWFALNMSQEQLEHVSKLILRALLTVLCPMEEHAVRVSKCSRMHQLDYCVQINRGASK